MYEPMTYIVLCFEDTSIVDFKANTNLPRSTLASFGTSYLRTTFNVPRFRMVFNFDNFALVISVDLERGSSSLDISVKIPSLSDLFP